MIIAAVTINPSLRLRGLMSITSNSRSSSMAAIIVQARWMSNQAIALARPTQGTARLFRYTLSDWLETRDRALQSRARPRLPDRAPDSNTLDRVARRSREAFVDRAPPRQTESAGRRFVSLHRSR